MIGHPQCHSTAADCSACIQRLTSKGLKSPGRPFLTKSPAWTCVQARHVNTQPPGSNSPLDTHPLSTREDQRDIETNVWIFNVLAIVAEPQMRTTVESKAPESCGGRIEGKTLGSSVFMVCFRPPMEHPVQDRLGAVVQHTQVRTVHAACSPASTVRVGGSPARRRR